MSSITDELYAQIAFAKEWVRARKVSCPEEFPEWQEMERCKEILANAQKAYTEACAVWDRV